MNTDLTLGVAFLREFYQPQENLIISPYTLLSSLLVIQLGVGDESWQSREKLARVTGCPSNNMEQCISQHGKAMLKDATVIPIANWVFLWEEFELSSDFENTVRESLDAELIETNQFNIAFYRPPFLSKQMYNELTGALAKVPFHEGDVAIASALKFSPMWKFSFNQINTNRERFYRTKRTANDSPEPLVIKFINNAQRAGYYKDWDSGVKALKLACFESRSLVLILPPKIHPMPVFIEKHLTARLLSTILDNFDHNTLADVTLPIFSFRKLYSPVRLLKKENGFNLEEFFNGTAKMDQMVEQDDPNPFIRAILQMAQISVNEGPEPEFWKKKPPLPKHLKLEHFFADRPFVFLVLAQKPDKVLAMGVMEVPGENVKGEETEENDGDDW